MNVGLVMALYRGGKAIVMSKPVRLALARYILDSVEKNEKAEAKPESK